MSLGTLLEKGSQIYAKAKGRMSKGSGWSFSGNVLPNAGVFDMSVRYGGTVVSSPIESGSFVSYNKTTEPIEIEATLSYEGTDAFLQSALSNMARLKESVTIFDITTPTQEYENFTLESYDYTMARENGTGVLYVKAKFKEIKEVQLIYTEGSPITQTQTNDVSATSTQDGGLQQGSTPSASEGTQATAKKQSLIRKWGIKA